MNEAQWNLFQERMIKADGIIMGTNKLDFMPVIRRLGNMTFRIIMILTVLRNQGNISEENKVLYAIDEDVMTGLDLFKILVDHSLNVFDKYDKKTLSLNMSERNLLCSLPDDFKRKEGLQIAVDLGFAERTYDDILRRWETKKIIQKVRTGNYQKTK